MDLTNKCPDCEKARGWGTVVKLHVKVDGHYENCKAKILSQFNLQSTICQTFETTDGRHMEVWLDA